MDIIVDRLNSKGVDKIESNYLKTYKNEQVSNLYDRYGFEIIEKNDDQTRYKILVKDYKNKNLNYIREKNGR